MQRVVLLLLGMASLVASGVIMDRGRVGLNAMHGLGLQTARGIRDAFGDAGNVLTRDELLRQKFILDIFRQIYAPLQQQDLLKLDDRNIITNEDLYMRPLTQEMQMVLDWINTDQMLSRQTICSINNERHVRQAVGFYRLLVAARDFDTFQRLVVYGRQNINTEMFVYCVVLALGERADTQRLIVPALYEILPQLFVNDQIIDQVRRLDTGVSSLRPQIMDIMGRRNFLFSRFADQQQQQQQEQEQGGLLDVLTRSQLWMPWRELHKQIALRKVIDGNVVQQDQTQIDKLVVSLPGNGLLSQDISLRSYIGMFVDQLLLNRDIVRNTNRNQIGGERYEAEQGNIETRYRGNRLGASDEINENIYGGVRQGMDIDVDINRNREINAGRRLGLDIDRRFGTVEDENNSLWEERRLNRNRFDVDEERDMGRNIYMGRKTNMQESQRGINTVSANDARLLFLGRRRQNPNTVITMRGNRFDEDDVISGGRRVVKNDMIKERQRTTYDNYNDELRGRKYYNDIDDEVTVDRMRKMNNERYINNDEEDMQEVQRGVNTVSANDARLLFLGRRRQNLMRGERYDEDDLISGGRRVVKDDLIKERQRTTYDNYNDELRGRKYYNDIDDEVTVDRMRRMNNERYINNDEEYLQEGQRDINTDRTNQARLLALGRRGQNVMRSNRYDEDDFISGGRRVVKDDLINERQSTKYGNYKDERLGDNYYNDIDEVTADRMRRMNNERYINNDEEYLQEGQRGINTDRTNPARLLPLGRRGPNVMRGNRYDEDDFISGGRRVVKDDLINERQSTKYGNYNDERRGDNYYNDIDEVTADRMRKMNNERFINNNEQDINSYEGNDYWNRNYGGRGISYRDNFLNMVTGGRMGQRQYMENDRDSMYNRGWTNQYNRENLDEKLPTTNINDERLLYINRRKLNNFDEGRYINNNEGAIYEDVNDRYNTDFNTDYQRRNMNVQRSYMDDQTKRDTTYRGNQYGRSGIYDNENVNYREENLGRRSRRSIVNQEQDQYLGQTSTVNGRLVLHTLQQLVARLNIERIALGQPLLIEITQGDIARGVLMNSLVGSNARNGISVQTFDEIERLIQQIDNALQQRIGQITVASYTQKVNEIGLLLAGQIQGLGLTDILGDVLQQTNQQERRGLVVNLLENQAAQVLLAGIVRVVDERVQQVYRQREEFISTLPGVNINDVEVDRLQTYLEQTDIDLSNLLNINRDQTIQDKRRVVVGRSARLNHKNFNVKIDVTSDRQQQVVVRNLLVPKIDGQNNIIPLVQRRQNVIVLDITTVELQQGRNSLNLKSNDITITSRDTTPLTKIYQLVMQALNGDITLQQNILNGQSTLLPHHLLLPRGRTNGLPMQLITVITPLQKSSRVMETQRGNPLNTLFLDNLPLNYPLHCDITDLDKVTSMPNLMVSDVKIYHEDNIQMPIVY